MIEEEADYRAIVLPFGLIQVFRDFDRLNPSKDEFEGSFAFPVGVGLGTDREGVYVAANYNYLHGIRYHDLDSRVRMDTDNAGPRLPSRCASIVNELTGPSKTCLVPGS